jgi:hypothetical protein
LPLQSSEKKIYLSNFHYHYTTAAYAEFRKISFLQKIAALVPLLLPLYHSSLCTAQKNIFSSENSCTCPPFTTTVLQQLLQSSEKYMYLSPFHYHYTPTASAELRKIDLIALLALSLYHTTAAPVEF